MKSRRRWAYGIAVVLLAVFCVHGRALAISEFCPAKVSAFHRTGDASSTLYTFRISAYSRRSVSGDIVVKAGNHWYQVAFPAVELTAHTEERGDDFAEFSSTLYESPPIFVRLSAPSDMVSGYVADARTVGENAFGWDAKGDVACAPPAGFGIIEMKLQQHGKGFNLPPYVDTSPPVDPLILAATTIAPPGSLDCTTPFTAASVERAASPDYPLHEERTNTSPVAVFADVLVDADGMVVDTWIIGSSGKQDFDEATLKAVRASTYSAGTAFCKPVRGEFIFRAEFSPP